jgi:plastocyanin
LSASGRRSIESRTDPDRRAGPWEASMRTSLHRVAFAAIALVLVATAPGNAWAAGNKDVAIIDRSFQPADTSVQLNGSVTWRNKNRVAHTSSSDPVFLWNSGRLDRGQTFTFTFVTAGTFPYRCFYHPKVMRGTVAVSMRAKPSEGPVGSVFRIIWATADPGTDFEYNVRVTDANGATFHAWKTGVAHDVLSGRFKPTQAGVYQFESQLERVSTGETSLVSPVLSITVT